MGDEAGRTLEDDGRFQVGDMVYIRPGSETDEKLHGEMTDHVLQIQMALGDRGIRFDPATDFPPGALYGWRVRPIEIEKTFVLHGIPIFISMAPMLWADLEPVAATDADANADIAEVQARRRRGGRKTRRTQRKTRRRRQSRRRV